MNCRTGCAACCIAPSISSVMGGKVAGVPCIELDADLNCSIFNQPHRPKVCVSLKPSLEMCGTHREHAMIFLTQLERATA